MPPPVAFSFDDVPDRRQGDSVKWNLYGDRDVLPLWVADMDFPVAPAIRAALHRRIEHGVLGYAEPTPALRDAACDYMRRLHDWDIDPDWLLPLPGLVTGLNVVCRAVGDPDSAVLTATPVYPPFLSAPRLAGRRLQTVELVRSDAGWLWDWDALEQALTPEVRLLLLCHPHNPVGRVWQPDELRRLASLAEQHDLVLCSDEIHAGLVLEPGVRHRALASLDEAVARRSVTLISPSKTWNVPGLGCAFAVVPDPTLRRRLRRVMDGIVPHVNALGLVACEAAWRDGEPWRVALIDYLRHNRDTVVQKLAGVAGLQVTSPEATYLAWIDCRGRDLPHPATFFEQAGVGLSDGTPFGAPGCVRLNFGCTRATLDEALQRMVTALQR